MSSKKRKRKGKNKKKEIGIGIISGVIISLLAQFLSYWFSPSYVDVSALILSTNFCQINDESDTYGLFCLDCNPQVNVFLDNNNEGFIRVNKVSIKTKNFTALNKHDVTLRNDIGGLGEIEKSIYLKTKVSSSIGQKHECEYNYELDDYSYDDYIELANNSSDKFHITLEPEQSGKYEIQFEIEYTYHGIKKKIKTKTYSFVYINQFINNFYE